MQLRQFGTMLDVAKAMNRLLLIAFLFMTTLSVILGLCIYRAIGHKSFTWIPPVINQQFTISDVVPDQSYLNQMGRFLLSLQLDITPSNVIQNHTLLLKYVSSDQYHTLKAFLSSDAQAIISGKTSSAFYPKGAPSVDMNKLAIRIQGELKKWSGERALAPEQVTYEIRFSYHNGTLLVQSIHQVQQEN